VVKGRVVLRGRPRAESCFGAFAKANRFSCLLDSIIVAGAGRAHPQHILARHWLLHIQEAVVFPADELNGSTPGGADGKADKTVATESALR
jgi:hypothetical protein